MNTWKTWLSGAMALTAGILLYAEHRQSNRKIESLTSQVRALSRVVSDEARVSAQGERRPEPTMGIERLRQAYLNQRDADERTDDQAQGEAAATSEKPARKARDNTSPAEDYAPFHTTMEVAFAEDVPDPAWAAEASRLAKNGLLRALPQGSTMGPVECRGAICRVESTHASRDAAEQLVTQALVDPTLRPWNGSFSTGLIEEESPGGPVVLVTYLMREGKDLPDDEESAL